MPAEAVVAVMRAAGETTRLRALALLSHGELAVGELAAILGQSQPRVSRHMRLLTEQGLVERTPEGSWVFYRLPAQPTPSRALIDAAVASIDPRDPALVRDLEKLREIRAARDAAAEAYFRKNAQDWSRVRALHLPDADIEAAMLAAAGPGPFGLHVDVGVGAGRMIALFAQLTRRAVGLDTSREMLAVARAELDDLAGPEIELRFGDAYRPPLGPGAADLVTIHHVLHFLADPPRAIAEAARLLKRGGVLLIADFAPHALEFLREEHAHRRLGFSDDEIAGWCRAAGAPVVTTTTLAPESLGDRGLTVKIWKAVLEDDAGGAP